MNKIQFWFLFKKIQLIKLLLLKRFNKIFKSSIKIQKKVKKSIK